MNYKISKLQARYGLSSKQSVYDRMKALQIVPVSRGEISSQAVYELDKLDEFMKKNPGAKIWEFPRDVEYESSGQLDKSSGQLDNFNETLQLVEAIARHLAANQDPLAKYKALEYAANHIMLLPTSKVKELIGAKPSKSQFQRGTFVFTKTDIKIGRESAWRTQMTPNAFRPTPEYQTAPGDRWEKLHQSLNPGLEQTD
jgi:hypothetical protein